MIEPSRPGHHTGLRSLALCLLAVVWLFAPGEGHAQGMDHSAMGGMDHGAHTAHASHANGAAARPTASGQAAFAAIQEIVALLEADPSTDWEKVDIAALRRHLIDMDNVTLHAEVSRRLIDGGARYTVTGSGPVRDSIRRMVLAHAATMNGVGGWSFAAEKHPLGAVLTVTTDRPAEVAKVRGVGFIGAMARGSHHQAHHLMIARGLAPHH